MKCSFYLDWTMGLVESATCFTVFFCQAKVSDCSNQKYFADPLAKHRISYGSCARVSRSAHLARAACATSCDPKPQLFQACTPCPVGTFSPGRGAISSESCAKRLGLGSDLRWVLLQLLLKCFVVVLFWFGHGYIGWPIPNVNSKCPPAFALIGPACVR